MGPPALLLLQRKVCCGFLSPLKIHRLGQIWTPNFESNGKLPNHYTTKVSVIICWFYVKKGIRIKM
jgi:hypothetical protein